MSRPSVRAATVMSTRHLCCIVPAGYRPWELRESVFGPEKDDAEEGAVCALMFAAHISLHLIFAPQGQHFALKVLSKRTIMEMNQVLATRVTIAMLCVCPRNDASAA